MTIRWTEAQLREHRAKMDQIHGKLPDPVARAAQPKHAAWDASWLKQREAQAAAARGEPTLPAPARIEFSIPLLLKLPNQTNGKHWTAGMKYRAELLPIVAEAVEPWAGREPINKARIIVTRRSLRPVDEDNLAASLKPLVDLLLVRSETHPHSLGLLVEDNPDHLSQSARHVRVSERRLQRTVIVIEACREHDPLLMRAAP